MESAGSHENLLKRRRLVLAPRRLTLAPSTQPNPAQSSPDQLLPSQPSIAQPVPAQPVPAPLSRAHASLAQSRSPQAEAPVVSAPRWPNQESSKCGGSMLATHSRAQPEAQSKMTLKRPPGRQAACQDQDEQVGKDDRIERLGGESCASTSASSSSTGGMEFGVRSSLPGTTVQDTKLELGRRKLIVAPKKAPAPGSAPLTSSDAFDTDSSAIQGNSDDEDWSEGPQPRKKRLNHIGGKPESCSQGKSLKRKGVARPGNSKKTSKRSGQAQRRTRVGMSKKDDALSDVEEGENDASDIDGETDFEGEEEAPWELSDVDEPAEINTWPGAREAWKQSGPMPGQPGFCVRAHRELEAAGVLIKEPAEANPARCPVDSHQDFVAASTEVANSSTLMELPHRQLAQSTAQPQAQKEALCPPLQTHQEVVAFLVHPPSPITRLLVDQPTGAGKTREMIGILDIFFSDNRAKIPIFPREAVCRNFYEELLRWPNRYRDFFCCINPKEASYASGGSDWRQFRKHHWSLTAIPAADLQEICATLREVLEMKNVFAKGRFRHGWRARFRKAHPGESIPSSPLRALSYASAGGGFCKLGPDGKPISSLLKIGYTGGSVYSHKVVLMDEMHNLVRSQTRYPRQLANLRHQLTIAEGGLFVGFTATPILGDPKEGRVLLDVVKGLAAATLGDEGFICTLLGKTPPLFPKMSPQGVPDKVLTETQQKQLCREVPLKGEALKSYIIKHSLGLPAFRLRAYCNMARYFGNFHGTCRESVLADAHGCLPKFMAIANSVIRRREKAVVLVSRTTGFVAMLEVMRRTAVMAHPKVGVVGMDQLSDFNSASNSRGQEALVLVADALECSEGVSFKAVRRLYLADVPTSAGAFEQQCGRVSRMFGHAGLPADEQKVSVVVYVAVLPEWARTDLGAWALQLYCHPHVPGFHVEKKAQRFISRLHGFRIETLADLKTEVDNVLRRSQNSNLGLADLLERWDFEPEANNLRLPQNCRRKNPLVNTLMALGQAKAIADVTKGLAGDTVDGAMVCNLVLDTARRSPALAELRQHALSAGPEQVVYEGEASDAPDSDPDDKGVAPSLLPSINTGKAFRHFVRDDASDSDDEIPDVPLTFGRANGPQLPGLLKRRRIDKIESSKQKRKREDELWREEVALMASKMAVQGSEKKTCVEQPQPQDIGAESEDEFLVEVSD